MAKLTGPKIGVAGRVDPADLAICLTRLTNLGVSIANKSELVAYTFAAAAQLFQAQEPALGGDTYYQDHFDNMARLGLHFNSPRDEHDKFKALVTDSLEEFSPDDRQEVLEHIRDLRKKKKVAQEKAKVSSIEAILEDLGGEDEEKT